MGPPDALVEIRSPGDETCKKLPFYHSLGVPEVIVVVRDTRAVEVYARGAEEYERVPCNPSPTTVWSPSAADRCPSEGRVSPDAASYADHGSCFHASGARAFHARDWGAWVLIH